ncbi:MAG: hypothetical protein ACTSXO_01845 [Candidatus Heimdallarchaeota archaeon]|nr:MAG: hypothetical protein DRP02_03130 [Candidatus Gerdarchaeota archaeon]
MAKNEEELFRLTPMKPEYKSKRVHGLLFSFGGYTNPEGEYRLASQYLQDKIVVRQNKAFLQTDPLGNFWENATIRVQLKEVKIANDNLIKMTIKIKTKEKQIVQIFFGTQKIKVDLVEGTKIITLEIEPAKGDTCIHIRCPKKGSLLEFYEIKGTII